MTTERERGIEAVWKDAGDNDWLHLIDHLSDEAIGCILDAYDEWRGR